MIALVSAGAASARALDLGPLTCTGGAVSAQEAFALDPMALDCSPDRFADGRPFVRAHVAIDSSRFPEGVPLVWQSNPALYDSLLLQFTYADGSRRLVDVDRRTATRNWIAGNRFAVSVPPAAARLVEVDAVIEKPRAPSTLRNALLTDRTSAAREHYIRSLAYVLLCGLLIVPLVYDVLFYRVLRARFMLWHLAMATAMFVFVSSSSGLVFIPFPDMPLATRWYLSSVSLTITIAASLMFTVGLLERRVVPTWLSAYVIVATSALLVLKLIGLLHFEWMRMAIVSWYLVAVLAAAIGAVMLIAVGLAHRIRAAVFLAIGFSGMLLTLAITLLVRIGSVSVRVSLDDVLYAGLVIMVLGTSAGVADRFLVLRSERDRARSRASMLGKLALTDGLTGLLNRRAFDRLASLSDRHGLLLGDIDRFKQINDDYGHQAGDEVLCQVALVLREGMGNRHGVRVFRLGGEEFAIVAPIANGEDLLDKAEHLRLLVEEGTARAISNDLPTITISFGGVVGHGQSMREALAVADRALYRAKRGGRNRSEIDSAVQAGDGDGLGEFLSGQPSPI
ncbi:GGDEF domain-containing protein [Qipengyuania spongiae]|uniref:diguanylate cyclase n=1 Tax=Qipengyuania spongiae TaxID=2909673 RepID=A0ABY5SZN2_9SPHN|nr:diguanylate cyclase [Qipengyuania spongiae]UVI38694.1 GGDEF domain-containing protein [Qipengyuania spongiae]